MQTHRSASRRAPRGFSLIESMAALAVFSVGILGVMQMNVLASSQNGYARRQATASNIARDLAENFERLPYGHSFFTESSLAVTDAGFVDITNSTGLHSLSDAPATGELPLLGAAAAIATSDGISGQSFTVRWRVAPLKDGSVTVGRRILIMVRFVNPATGPRQVNFWTVKYDPGQLLGGLGSVAGFQEI